MTPEQIEQARLQVQLNPERFTQVDLIILDLEEQKQALLNLSREAHGPHTDEVSARMNQINAALADAKRKQNEEAKTEI